MIAMFDNGVAANMAVAKQSGALAAVIKKAEKLALVTKAAERTP